MKKLFLIFHGRFPSEKAAALFAAKSAESFAEKGFSVELLVPRRKGVDSSAAFEYFGVKKNFEIRELRTVDLFSGSWKTFAFWVSFVAFSISCFLYVRARARKEDIVYSNESLPLYFATFASKNTFYEMHDFPESKLGLFSKLLLRVRWILVHNKWKTEKLKETFGIPQEKIMFEPNAVDIGKFDTQVSAKEAREALGLPQDKKIAVYTGHLYGWKGVDVLAEAARLMDSNFIVAFVGGTPADIEKFKARYGSIGNIVIAGHRKHAEIPLWQKAADVLVLPNTGKEAISLYYTSPMKLFEYMASRRPIVASDIPSVTEIVSEKSAILVSPDDPVSLSRAVASVLKVPKIGESLAEEAFRAVSEHTWEKRAARIIRFMEHA